MLEKCIALITEQQGNDQEVNRYWLGEQLKDICHTTPGAAELVHTDMAQPGMSLADAEKKIEAYAKAHKKGSQACVPPHKADEILRAFYGIPADAPPSAAPAPKAGVQSINILDFM